MSVNWLKIKSMLKNFNEFYWNSEMVNNISLINDLRLSTNIHETAHSRILYKLLCAHGKEKHQFLKMFLESVGLKLDIDKAEIKVEYKHIDVLIYDGTRYVIIENKVNLLIPKAKFCSHGSIFCGFFFSKPLYTHRFTPPRICVLPPFWSKLQTASI